MEKQLNSLRCLISLTQNIQNKISSALVKYKPLFFSGVVIAHLGLLSISVNAAEQQLRLEVIDPYIELHTGPGKGYPIFYTVEQSEYITVLTKRTGWYEIKAQNGRIGWAKASQVARTLLPTGEPVDLPSISYGDYLKNSWRVGFSLGQFSRGELTGSDIFGYSLGYRPLSFMGVEIERGNFYETEVKGNYQGINLLIEPLSQLKLSPVLLIGSGTMEIESQPELTPLSFDKEDFTRIGLSVNYYIGRNFVLQTGFQSFELSTDNNDERLTRWNIGFNAFF
ncbi:MAG: SH3 domain-containing protein [Kangiellaceae bacterium]|nr:SH3 domain-containing protein [Kangiellaceae bacterium]MCW9016191.1 SH3 domain-containing protein [Kangiellaceae bacterium]